MTKTFLLAGLLVGGLITPAVADRMDNRLEDRIESRLNHSKLSDVTVDVEDGVATLKGEVATAAEKAQAARLARISGISSVDNQLQVDPDKAKSRIEERADARKERIEERAEMQKDAVERRAESAKERAERRDDRDDRALRDRDRPVSTADDRRGRERPGTSVSDSWVTAKVKSKFVGQDVLDGSDIKIDTDRDGVVTLSGSVRSEAARRRAVEITRATDGVRGVNDNLRVDAR